MNDNDNVVTLKPSKERNANPSVEEAIGALTKRGVTGANSLGTQHDPTLVIAWCEWWDGREAAGTGLLVSQIRSGEMPPRKNAPRSKQAELRASFAAYARRHPVGSAAVNHSTLQSRQRHPDDECVGEMVVEEANYPVVTLICNVCGNEAGLTAGAIHKEKVQ